MKIKEITTKSSKEIEVLESAINYLNKELFDSKLSKIKVTIQPDSGKNRTYGWACANIWKNEKESIHELNITANSLKRPFNEIWITLIHELIHLFAISTGDMSGATSRQGRYHGKAFKTLCDKFYLITEKDSQIGYTTPHGKMLPIQKEIYENFKNYCDINLNQLFKYERKIYEKAPKENKNKNSEYHCPFCDLKFTAKKGLKLICAECDEHLIEIEK